MNKNFKLFIALILGLALLLSGCSTTNCTSVWSDCSWMLPWITGLATLWFFFKSYRGSKKYRMPVYQFGELYFGAAFLITTVIIIWLNINNK